MSEFQPRCDQYQTDPEVILSVMPICIMKSEGGDVVKALTGRRFTTITFTENVDVRTNELELTNQEFDEKLRDVFGITLEKALDIESVVNNLKVDK